MTTPDERTRAVMATRAFLFALLDPNDTSRVPRCIRQWASRCLKHYPGFSDLEAAHRGAPATWGKPDAP